MDAKMEPNQILCDGVKAPSPKPPPESILITYYTSPVDFYYVTYQNAKASAHLVKNLEKELVQYCTPTKMQEKYARGQNVIVRYLAWTEPRMIRGQIMGQENEEYLVWITDYSFIICCVQADMWPLPEEMSRPIVEFHKGGVASITPYNGKEWLKSSRQLFGKLLENAIDLIYEVMYLDQSNNTKYGKLTIRSSSNEAAFDGATFLLDRKWASSPTKIIPMGRIENPVGFEVAEMNDQLTKPCQRVAKILKLVDDYALTIDPPATKSHLTKLVPDDEVDIGSNDVKAHSKPKILSRHEKNNQTQASLELMEEMLQCRNALLVPDTAKRFRRVNGQENPVGSGSCLTALRPKRVGANVDAISEEENDSPFNAPYNLSNVPTSVLLSQRSTSVDKPRRPLSTSTSYPQARPPRSTSVVQPMPIKSSSVSSRLITSESGTDVVSTTTGGTGVGQILSQKAKEIILGEHHSNDLTSLNHCVLAHSLKPATPIKELHKIPIYSGVKNEMHINSIYTPTPLQQYAWPHLCNGGSMILINSRATCRTWSYLPVICSTVKKAGFSAPTSPTSPGPLALLVTESPHSANTLFMQISNLMQNHDTHHPKIINGHNYSERELGILLLNSYSILVTTLSQLDTIIMDKPGVIDRNKLLFFVLDDFHTMQMKHPQIMDDLMQRLNDFRNPKTQIVIITQKWKSKPFKKLLKVMPDPLILFGNFLEAAMYGKLALSLSVQNEDQKFDKLLSFLGSHETLNKRTMIFFKTDKELIRHQKMLLDVGYKCIGILKAAEQQPYQLLLVSDQEGEVPLPIRNIETLIHYSFPLYWSKFAHRFHALADSIPNLAAPLTGNEKSITSVVMLGEKNQNELMRLVDFLRFHGITLSEEIAQLARACHEKNVGSRHICPYYLNNGNCHIFNCNKRHDYIREDMPDPGNPLLQPGTLIRCQLIKVYDPNHMSMWPLEFKAQGQDSWMDFGHHISHWTFSLEMSMGVRKVHNPYRLDDVCVVVRQGQVQRVRIVDIPPRRAVVVQQMDHGSELLHIKPSELLQCPEGKFTNQPAMALNIRLSGVEPASRNGQKWSEHSAKWTHEMLSNIGNNMHLQVIVDFTLHNVIYVKEITLVEECQFMRTSVYQFLLSKELVSRGFAKWVNKESGKTESKAVEEAKTQEVAEVEPNNNSPNSEDPTLNSNSEDAVPPPVKNYYSPITAIKNYLAEKKSDLLSEIIKKMKSIREVTKDHPIEEVLEECDEDQMETKSKTLPGSEDIQFIKKESFKNLSTNSKEVPFVSDNETDDELYEDPLTKSPKIKVQEEVLGECEESQKEKQTETQFPAPEDIQYLNKDLSDNLSTYFEKLKLVSDNKTDDEIYEDPLPTSPKIKDQKEVLEENQKEKQTETQFQAPEDIQCLNKDSSENLTKDSEKFKIVSENETVDEIYEEPLPTLPQIKDQEEVLEENQKDKQDIVPEDIECMNKDLSDNLSTDSEKCKLVSDNETDQLYKESLTIVKEDKNEKLEETNDSCLAFLKALQFEMETMSPSKKKETQDFLIGLLCEKEMKEPPKTKPVKALNFHGVPKKDSQEPSPEDVAASLQCGVIVNGSVNPKVKWHQDLSHIDLVIEQKVPEYKLILKNNSLVYMVSTTSPPQCCILNLLGEVAIESEKQIGYYLHIKLAKVGLIRLWPCLLSSFYAQQNAHWLTYNTELDKEPELSEAIIMWDSFERRRVDREEASSSEEYLSNDESDSEMCDDL